MTAPPPSSVTEALVETPLVPTGSLEMSTPILSASPLDLLVEAISHIPSVSFPEPSLPLSSLAFSTPPDAYNPWENFRQTFRLVSIQGF